MKTWRLQLKSYSSELPVSMRQVLISDYYLIVLSSGGKSIWVLPYQKKCRQATVLDNIVSTQNF